IRSAKNDVARQGAEAAQSIIADIKDAAHKLADAAKEAAQNAATTVHEVETGKDEGELHSGADDAKSKADEAASTIADLQKLRAKLAAIDWGGLQAGVAIEEQADQILSASKN